MRTQSDIRNDITACIIDALQNSTLPPWRKPWADDPNSPGLHTSLSTGCPYRGINQLILQCSAMKQGFKSKWWGTYNQIAFNGASVRRGQKATKSRGTESSNGSSSADTRSVADDTRRDSTSCWLRATQPPNRPQ